MLHQGDNLGDDLIEVERRRLWGGLSRERTDTFDHLSRPLAIPGNSLSGATCFVQVGRLAVEPAKASLGVADNCGERLVHFMGDRCAQFAKGRRARGMGEVCLRLAKFLLDPLALEDETVDQK